jgi:hypothetical protein
MSKSASDSEHNYAATKRPSRSTGVWLFLAGCLGAVFTMGAIFQVWLYIQQVQNGYQLAKLYVEYEQALAIKRKLRLEWVRFEDPFQLEEMGRTHFGLSPPSGEQKMFIR